ncbi:hypothetical protein [Micromonospora sp. NPDC049359]|uniref:pPIWI_RE_Z domain-containing protein n=1 Tax=Micromonospora sp. NPDC049359 TaxID=3364270 RepID=UPI0037B442AD
MRETSSWRDSLMKQMRREQFPEAVMARDAFCRVELGLHFLTKHFPGEPVGALQPLLSGYVDLPPELVAACRRVRHRMGDVARRGYWRRLLNHYLRVPQEWRRFARTDAADGQVNDNTVFTVAGSALCQDRVATYDAALADPLQYRLTPPRPPAPAGRRYEFRVGDSVEVVHLPSMLPPAPPVTRLPLVPRRSREPWTVSFEKELLETAKEIDRRLVGKPHITNRNWHKRLTENMRFSSVDRNGPGLVDRPETFVLDGVSHIVGLMNSGKTTLTDVLTVNRVLKHGNRVGMVLGSVGDVYAKVSFLRSIGIDAVPLIGRSNRAEHAARYWRSAIEESPVLVPDDDNPADPAAAYANASCLLEPFRRSANPDWKPLEPNEFPCHGKLRDAEADEPATYDCPLLSICPAQKAHREIANAQVWVTTAQCLIASRAEPADASMRWFEAFQPHTDLLVIDEADAVQQVLDSRFVQTEPLVAAGKGWTHRMVQHTNAALDNQSMAPAADDEVDRWHTQLQIHQNAVFVLNRLALSPPGQRLKELLGDAPFTAHSLLRRVARTLFGLPSRGEGDKRVEDLADDFYRHELQEFAESPLSEQPHSLDEVVAQVTRQPRTDAAVALAIDDWLDRWLEPNIDAGHVRREWFNQRRGLLRLVVEAAICAGRITTTFFAMTTMYPSVREHLQLPDEETFWADQPPRDYRPIVPEAPMGNILALRWADSRNGGASLQLLWVHGVGRWLLHHAHDLLACEGVQGPHVVLTSATSWAPGSSFYHIPIEPTAVLRPPPEDETALRQSHMAVKAQRNAADPIFVSGKTGSQRHDALRLLVTALCQPVDGRPRSVVDELRAKLPEDRRKILFVVLSGDEARTVGDHINARVPQLSARIVVPDAADPGVGGIQRRLVGRFGTGEEDILVAAEMSIQRGYNILNANDTAALGAVIYLTRSHPPPFDLAFPLSLVSQLAMDHLQRPPAAEPGEVGSLVKQLRSTARKVWFDAIGRPIQFRALDPQDRRVFVANNLVPMSQTIGRSIRGNQPTTVLLCDAAFAERLADPEEKTADTARTSIVVATDQYLGQLLATPADGASQHRLREHAVNTAVWGLMGHLVRTNEPLGSRRTPR